MKHNWKITIILLGLFLFSQYLGLFILSSYINVQKSKEAGVISWEALPSIAGVPMERPVVKEKISFAYIFVAIIIGTIIFLSLIKFRFFLFWKLWYFLAIWIAIAFALGAFLKGSLAWVLAFFVSLIKIFRPNVIFHNLTELFIYAGIAVLLVPILNIVSIGILLLLISLYDIYAVWITGHMIQLAKFQAKRGVFAGLLLPYQLPKKTIAGLKVDRLKRKKIKLRMAVLGGGDISFPLIFSGVMLKTFGLSSALITPFFTGLALFVLLTYGKKGKFYPAMPFIALGCLAAYLAVLAINFVF